MVGIPFDSTNSIWWKNKYTRGVGGKKRVGVRKEMEICRELRGGNERWWRRRGRTNGRAEGRKKRSIGSGDELKHLVPGWSHKPLHALILGGHHHVQPRWRIWDHSSSSPLCNAALIEKIRDFPFYGSLRVAQFTSQEGDVLFNIAVGVVRLGDSYVNLMLQKMEKWWHMISP